MDDSHKEKRIKFSASFDKATELLTLISFRIVLPLLIVYFVMEFAQNPVDASVMLVFLSATGVYCLVFRPWSYILMQDGVVIHRLIGDIRIPFSNIRKFRRLSTDELKLVRGVYGFSRISGYFGKYTDPILGRLTFYATRRDRSILIETGNEKIVISPDHTELFMEKMTKLSELGCAA